MVSTLGWVIWCMRAWTLVSEVWLLWAELIPWQFNQEFHPLPPLCRIQQIVFHGHAWRRRQMSGNEQTKTFIERSWNMKNAVKFGKATNRTCHLNICLPPLVHLKLPVQNSPVLKFTYQDTYIRVLDPHRIVNIFCLCRSVLWWAPLSASRYDVVVFLTLLPAVLAVELRYFCIGEVHFWVGSHELFQHCLFLSFFAGWTSKLLLSLIKHHLLHCRPRLTIQVWELWRFRLDLDQDCLSPFNLLVKNTHNDVDSLHQV